MLQVEPGWWIYVGSAFGPGGLYSRVNRHLTAGTVRHWHIDYFKPAGVIKEIWYTTYPVPREHDWARIILSLPGAQIPLKRFGATDCTCPTHLIYFASRPNVKVCAAAMQAHFEDADFHSLIIPES